MHLKGKKCLVTGGTSGIGKETVKGLALLGAEVIFTTRDINKGNKVKDELQQVTGSKNITYLYCDLASFRDIYEMAQAYQKQYDTLHILINNAGVWETKRKLSKDGIERIFAVNHLAPFLLTNLLLDTLKNSAPARIINVSSGAHKNSNINFSDIEMKKEFNGYKAYCQSKHANILFTKELSLMLENTGVSVNALHPGMVSTNIFKHIPSTIRKLMKIFMLSPEKGAKSVLYLATSDETDNISGAYFNKKRREASTAEAGDREHAHKLWKISEDYVREWLNK